MGSEKLIPRFPLSHISTARALSRAEAGSERSTRTGALPAPGLQLERPHEAAFTAGGGSRPPQSPEQMGQRRGQGSGHSAVSPSLRPRCPSRRWLRRSPVHPPEWDAYCRPQPAVPSLPAPSASRHSQSSSRSWHSSPRPSSSLAGAGAGAGDPRLPAALAGGSAGRERRD